MAAGTPLDISQILGAANDYGGNSHRSSSVGKMVMGPTSKKTKQKAPNLVGSKRLSRPVRKGM